MCEYILIDRDIYTHMLFVVGFPWTSTASLEIHSALSMPSTWEVGVTASKDIHLVKETSLQGFETVSSKNLLKKCVNDMYKDAESKLQSCVSAIDFTYS